MRNLLDLKHEYDVTTDQWSLVHKIVAEVDRQHYWHMARNERVHKLLQSNVPDLGRKSFLEVGSGGANVVGYLCEQGMNNLTGWEINPDALKIAKLRYPSIRFENTDFMTCTDQFDRFDIVGHFDFLEHIENDLDCLQHLIRFIKPGGVMIMVVPAMPRLWSWLDESFGHFRRYEKKGLREILSKAGFKDIRASYMMGPLVPLIMLKRNILESKNPSTMDELEALYARDSGLPHPILNEALKALLRLETSLMPSSDFGFGSSLIACARRPVR